MKTTLLISSLPLALGVAVAQAEPVTETTYSEPAVKSANVKNESGVGALHAQPLQLTEAEMDGIRAGEPPPPAPTVPIFTVRISGLKDWIK